MGKIVWEGVKPSQKKSGSTRGKVMANGKSTEVGKGGESSSGNRFSPWCPNAKGQRKQDELRRKQGWRGSRSGRWRNKDAMK